jgi:hypothetical protein
MGIYAWNRTADFAERQGLHDSMAINSWDFEIHLIATCREDADLRV